MMRRGSAAFTELARKPLFLHGATRMDRLDAARRLHRLGERARRPFVVAALTTLPGALREEALFGEARTVPPSGAGSGWLEQARGGTLLLDEIDCLCPVLQARLLAAVTPEEGDVALLLSSRHDPALLQRLGGLDGTMRAWISALDPAQLLGPERIEAVCRLRADGNARPRGLARTLERTLERALERPLADYLAAGPGSGPAGGPEGGLYASVMGEVERPLIVMTLRRTGGNQLRAAAILGLNRNTLRKKIRELDIALSRGEDE